MSLNLAPHARTAWVVHDVVKRDDPRVRAVVLPVGLRACVGVVTVNEKEIERPECNGHVDYLLVVAVSDDEVSVVPRRMQGGHRLPKPRLRVRHASADAGGVWKI